MNRNTQDGTRRAFLAQAAAFGLITSECLRGQTSTGPGTPTLWDGPASGFFGVTHEGALLDPASAYRLGKNSSDRLSFDISNNQIACSVNHRGLLDRVVVEMGIVPVETDVTPVGAYVDKVLVRGGPWPISIRFEGEEAGRLDELPQPSVSLRGNLFPLFVWMDRGVEIRMLAFAPVQAEPYFAPRAIVALVGLKNTGAAPVSGSLLAGAGKDAGSAFLLDGKKWAASRGEFRFSLAGGASIEVPLGFTLDANAEDAAVTVKALEARSAGDLYEQTFNFHRTRYGHLAIPEGAYFAELFQRAGELTRQALLRLPDGRFGGGFNGSDLPDPSTVWMKDCMYASLPQSFLDPDLCADAILFFLKWGVPSRRLGPGVSRFPGTGPVTNSLGNSVAGMVLAGAYYQMTADRNFFRKHPEILTRGEEILNEVLASRHETPYLFPSLYVSDGDARGDFHTGSNTIVWRAFRSMARLAKEVYDAPALAEAWGSIATKIQDAIRTRCTATGTNGLQFVEGAMADETFFGLHDGEESDTTLMPFYGFCEHDDPAYLNHARLGVTPENPYFFKEGDGIWWYAHGKWSSATFPGWMTALAGAETEEEILSRLGRIRSLTDADGSFWWWPFRHDAPPTAQPARNPVKCGWAAGVFACLFTNTILGISVDIPARQVGLRPFSPWNEFTWTNCRMGAGTFDFSYKKEKTAVTAEIGNLNKTGFEAVVELLLPAQARVLACNINGKAGSYTVGPRYRASAARIAESIPPGGRLRVEVLYEG